MSPIMNPIMSAAIKLIPFRKSVTRQPKNLASTGILTIPTIISVVIKTATVDVATPLFNKTLHIGKAINPGKRATEPSNAAMSQPTAPLPGPM